MKNLVLLLGALGVGFIVARKESGGGFSLVSGAVDVPMSNQPSSVFDDTGGVPVAPVNQDLINTIFDTRDIINPY